MAITLGRVRGTAIPGTRIYFKPTLGKIVFRPNNVNRTSANVLKINKILIGLAGSASHPATKCGATKGRKPLRMFLSCLRKEMMAIIKPLPTSELREDYAKLVANEKVLVKGRA
jgi:ATP-dependent protease HslVU (ClpYQ) ATPase subunit